MPIWVWIFFGVVISYAALVLWRAWSESYVKFGPIRYTREADPIYFYFLAAVFLICEIAAIAFFVLTLVSLLTGPIVQQ
jgi:hypothetical protein